jgi:RHS repeat-associated protein
LQSAYDIPITNSVTMIDNYNYSNSYFSFTTSDFNGDGRDDVAMTNLDVSTRTLNAVNIYSSNGGTTFVQNNYSIPVDNLAGYTFSFNKISPNWNFYYQGDFDGDGRSDYITILSNSTGYVAHYSRPSVSGGMNIRIYNPYMSNNPIYGATDFAFADVNYVLDFNGDGKSDLMCIKDGSCKIYQIVKNTTNTQYGAYRFDLLYNSGYPTKWHEIRFGDFNGDRKTDILTKAKTNGLWEIGYSTGKWFTNNGNLPFINFDAEMSFPASTTNHCKEIAIGDYNADGKSDIAFVYTFDSPTVDGEKANVYYSTGKSFKKYALSLSNSYFGCFRLNSGDLTGDGRTDLLWKTNGVTYSLVSFKKDGKERLLDKVTNGMNVTTEFNYKRLTDNSDFYKQGNIPSIATNLTAGYPLNAVCYPFYSVNAVKTPDGLGGTNTITYKYENARLHRAGRGFLGFEKVISEDVVNNTQTINQTEINSTYYVTLPKSTSVFNLADGNLLSIQTNETVVNALPNNRYNVLNMGIENKDLLQNVTRKVNYVFDNSGNITQSTTSINNLETASTTTSYGAFGTVMPYLPISTTTQSQRTGQVIVSTSSNFNYDTKGNVISKIDYPSQAMQVSTTITYNDFGNKTSETIAAAGLNARKQNFAYDNKGRFVTSKSRLCNTCGPNFTQIEYATYHPLLGFPLTQTSTDCQTTQFQYDGFGRLVNTQLPTGVDIYNSLDWDVFANTLVVATQTQAGKPTTKSWSDMLGRIVKTKTESLNSNWVTTKSTYNAKGQVASSTNSYLEGLETPITTNFTYDNFNRLKTENNGLNIYNYVYAYQPTYSRFISTKNGPNGKFSSTTKDASGKIVQSEDNGGKVIFRYDSWGNQYEIRQNGLVAMLKTFDTYNRQIALAEANAGMINTQYNAFGEITNQIDANGNQYSFTYDELGRLLAKTGSEGTTAYSYYCKKELPITIKENPDYTKPPSPLEEITFCCNNNIVKIQCFNGIIQDFGYDDFGRLISKQDAIDGATYQTKYQYDIYDNNVSIEYPTGIIINNVYDAKGFLTEVNRQGAGNIFRLQNLNGMGQVVKYNLGNGVTTNQIFTNGFPTSFVTPSIQHYAMAWNTQTGNLLNRKDVLKNLSEDFTYDVLNRLTSAKVQGFNVMDFNYDSFPNTGIVSQANLTKKQDAGLLGYYNLPHAQHSITNLTSTLLPPPNISTNVQTMEYEPFQRVSNINENDFDIKFTYEPGYKRMKSVLSQNGNLMETKYYFDGYEIKEENGNNPTFLHYVNGGAGLCAIIVMNAGNINTYYVYKDHLGSINTITNAAGSVIFEQNYDAWGRSRNPNNWTYTAISAPPTWLYRGYTGHEHLPQFGLINMNARLYDPIVGKMISPDNFVSNPFSTQAYNRYSYANNNPLVFTDPDGNFAWFVPLIFGAVNLGFDLMQNNGKMTLGEMALSFGTGAVGGLLAATGAGGIATVGGAFMGASFSQINRLMPQIPLIQSDNFTLSISPMIAFGSHGIAVGASLSSVLSIGDVIVGGSVGAGHYSGLSDLGGCGGPGNFSNWGVNGGYFNGKSKISASWGTNKFTGGSTNQSVGAIGINIGFTRKSNGAYHEIGLRLDEDFIWDKGDRYRTGGLFATYSLNKDVSIAFGSGMLTGDAGRSGIVLKHLADGNTNLNEYGNSVGTYDNCQEANPGLRGGTFFGGVIYKNQAYFIGNNSENRLHKVQNWIHQNIATQTAYFQNLHYNSRSFGFYGTYMNNYLFY